MKNAIIAVLLCLGFTYASAQDVYTSSGKPGYQKNTKKKKKGYDPDKLILGGGISGGFSDGYLSAGVSPIVGYRFFPHFDAGVGLGYLYSQVPINYYSASQTSYIREHIVYPNIWSRYFVYRNLFVSAAAEYDLIFEKGPSYDPITGNPTTEKVSVNNTCLFLGVGYKFPLGGRVGMYVEGLYDVLQGTNSPYAPGFPTAVHIGFAVGL